MFDQNQVIFISGQRGGGKSHYAKKLALSFPRCIIFDTLGEYQADYRFYDIESLIEFLERDQADPSFFTVAFDHYDSKGIFPLFCRVLLACKNIHIVIEEIDLFCTPFLTDVNFLKILKYGRHFGLQLVGISRRPAEVSRAFTSACSQMVIFRQIEPRDVDYFKSLIGHDALKIPELAQYHYLHCDFDQTPTKIQISNPI